VHRLENHGGARAGPLAEVAEGQTRQQAGRSCRGAGAPAGWPAEAEAGQAADRRGGPWEIGVRRHTQDENYMWILLSSVYNMEQDSASLLELTTI
jgi:hypothetical protein